MGYLNALGMAEQTDLTTAVQWHLRYNMYPPVPLAMTRVAVQAINSIVLDLPDTLIALPDGVSYRGEEAVEAWRVVDSLRLDAFVDNVLDQDWGDDEY